MAQPLYDRFDIRMAGDADLDAVVNLWQQLPGLTLRAEDTPEKLQQVLSDGRLQLYVAVCGTEIVAAIMVGADGLRGHLYHLAVAERKQGLGLGRALVESALEELAARRISRSHVFVQLDNEDARGFWMRMGWQLRTDLAVFSHAALEPNHAR